VCATLRLSERVFCPVTIAGPYQIRNTAFGGGARFQEISALQISCPTSLATPRHGTIGSTTREAYWPLCRIVWAALIISVADPNFAPVLRLRS
jgi:hypothetical protein